MNGLITGNTSIYIMEFYSAIKRKEVLKYAIIWMNLGNIMLSERSQSQKLYIMSFNSTYIKDPEEANL